MQKAELVAAQAELAGIYDKVTFNTPKAVKFCDHFNKHMQQQFNCIMTEFINY